jgi:hypothetical protein
MADRRGSMSFCIEIGHLGLVALLVPISRRSRNHPASSMPSLVIGLSHQDGLIFLGGGETFLTYLTSPVFFWVC